MCERAKMEWNICPWLQPLKGFPHTFSWLARSHSLIMLFKTLIPFKQVKWVPLLTETQKHCLWADVPLQWYRRPLIFNKQRLESEIFQGFVLGVQRFIHTTVIESYTNCWRTDVIQSWLFLIDFSVSVVIESRISLSFHVTAKRCAFFAFCVFFVLSMSFPMLYIFAVTLAMLCSTKQHVMVTEELIGPYWVLYAKLAVLLHYYTWYIIVN